MNYLFYIIIGLHFLFLLFQVILTCHNLSLIKNISGKPKKNLRKCSIIIPARNEVDRIEKCLKSLLKNNSNVIEEIIIVDNGSTDGTGDLIKYYKTINKNIHYFYIKDDKLGVSDNRKSVSLDYAAQKATSDWLLFIDADIWLADNALETIASDIAIDKNIVTSFVPKHFPLTWWERYWLNPYLLFNCSFYKLKKMYNKNSQHAILIGACWFINKYTYFSVGGFKSVYSDIVEDYAFAELLKKKGYSVQLVDGTKLFFLRNYFSFKQLYSTTKKGIATMNISYIQKVGLVLFFFILSFLPFVLIIPFFNMYLLIVASIYFLVSPLAFLPIRGWSSQAWYTYFSYPLGYLLLFIISCDAFFGPNRNKLTWRGVNYQF